MAGIVMLQLAARGVRQVEFVALQELQVLAEVFSTARCLKERPKVNSVVPAGALALRCSSHCGGCLHSLLPAIELLSQIVDWKSPKQTRLDWDEHDVPT